MHSRLSALALCLLLCAAPTLADQYVEPSVAEFFRRSSGIPSQLFGWAVAPLGDLDGDGVIDLAVSAPFAANGTFSTAGRIYALSGASGATLWQHAETRTSAVLGFSLETMDWNADGVLDVVAGAPFAAAGRAFVFSGVDGSTLAQFGGEATDSGFGAALATGGDFDGDGRPDLLIAAPGQSTPAGTSTGRVYVYQRGASSAYATLDGPYAQAQFGLGLAFVGDTSSPRDGRDELVVGWRDASVFTDGFAAVYAWSGASAAQRYAVSGVGMGLNLSGDGIDGGGDANGDGVPDFLVGDRFHAVVALFSGADGARLATLADAIGGGDFGAAHFIRDRDGDGRSEIAVGASDNGTGDAGAGKLFVFSGATGAVLRTITPRSAQLHLGTDVRDLGDFNGDGTPDLVAGCFGDGVRGFSGHLPAPANRKWPAERRTDPKLVDTGGDPTAGPIVGSPIEVFNLDLDCRSAPTSGPFAIRVRRTTLSVQVPTSFGWSWIGGPLLYLATGVQARDVVHLSPAGIVLPSDPALIGLDFGVQGSCGGRLSNALEQTIGR